MLVEPELLARPPHQPVQHAHLDGVEIGEPLPQRAAGAVAEKEQELHRFQPQVRQHAGDVGRAHDRAGDLRDRRILKPHRKRWQADEQQALKRQQILRPPWLGCVRPEMRQKHEQPQQRNLERQR